MEGTVLKPKVASIVLLLLCVFFSACGNSESGNAPPCLATQEHAIESPASELAAGLIERVCPQRRLGVVHCLAYRRTKKGRFAVPASAHHAALSCDAAAGSQTPALTLVPAPSPVAVPPACSAVPANRGQGANGYGPADLQSAYGFTCVSASGGSGKIVAVIESNFNEPTLEQDLGVYRTRYGLPSCTFGNGCLQTVGQDGGSVLPPVSSDGGETMLDVDMVSAMCPKCRILVVETNGNLYEGIDSAAKAGAVAISNSWEIFPEDGQEAADMNHPGIAVTVAAGDEGYASDIGEPDGYSSVVVVGGTTLQTANNARGWSETLWSQTASGCSKFIAKPAWQTDTACASMRTANDIAFEANPLTGVAIYDSTSGDGQTGWQTLGGTSAGAPAIAAMYAAAGATASDASSLYAAAGSSALTEITQGANGSCTPAILCNAGIGYNAPSGNGTPYGASAL